jgi:hypothetical protein
MHSTDNLEDGYFGGGKRIKNSVKKHGKDAHRKEILEFFENRELLIAREIELINEQLLNDPLCMNLAFGGIGGLPRFTSLEKEKEFHRLGAIALNKKIKENPEKWKNSMIGNSEKISKVLKNMFKSGQLKPSFKGKSHSSETISKMKDSKIGHGLGSTNSQFGTKWMYNTELKKSIKVSPEEIKKLITEGWILGRKFIPNK